MAKTNPNKYVDYSVRKSCKVHDTFAVFENLLLYSMLILIETMPLGEPYFIESPEPLSEDDGVVVSTVIKPDGTSVLLFLDAISWEELGRATLPYGLPSRFHSHFVRDISE